MGKPLKVLLAEDSEDDALLVLRQLKLAGFEPDFLRVDDTVAFRQALAARDWDIVLSDYKMPSFTGADALKAVQEAGKDIPFIIISGTIGEETAVAMMKAGAHDYILKNALGRLVPAVERELREAEVRRDKRKKEHSLLKSEANLRKAEQIALLGNWEWNIQTNEFLWSDEVYRIYGMDPGRDRPSYDMVVKIVAPGDRDRFVSALEAAARQGTPFDGEYRIIGMDGRERHTYTTGEVGRDRSGRPVTLFGVVQDITRRRKVEYALRKADALYHELVETAQDLIWQCDAGGRYTYLNGAWEDVLGYGVEEMLGRKFSDFQDPVIARRDAELFSKLLAGGTVKGYETVHRAKNGSSVHLVFNAINIRDEQGNIVGTRGTAHDITERKQATEKLTHMHELMQYVISHAQTAIAVHDKDMKYIYVSDQYLRQYKVSEKDVIGRHHYDVFPDLPQKWRDVHRRVLAGAVEGKDEDPYVREDGSTDWTRWECRPWYERDGSIGGLIVYTEVITERKRREDALRASEERHRRLFEESPISLWEEDFTEVQAYFATLRRSGVSDINAHFVANPEELRKCAAMVKVLAVNQATLDIYEARDQSELLRGLPRVFTPDSLEAFRSIMAALFDGKRSYECEAVNQTLSGRRLNILLRWSLLPGTLEQGTRGLVSIVDITERMRATEENERLARAVSIVTEGIAVTDEEDRFVYVNDAHAKTYGYAAHELMGKTWRDLTPPDIVPLVAQELGRTLHARKIGAWSGEAPGLCRDGTRKDTEITATARWSEKGVYLGHICVIRDITERKRAEEKLRQSEEFIRGILDTVDEGFIVIDRDYRIVTANKAYCSHAGLGGDEVVGRHCYEISHGLSRPCFEAGEECAVQAVFATGEPRTSLHKHPGRNGTMMYVETKAYPVKDAAGGVRSVIETINNITEKHLLEEERLKTQKLESIGTLAGGIAHDFNNLLQGVFGYISMAKLTYDERGRSLAMLEQAEKALQQSVSLASQLLTFSKGGKPVRKRTSLAPVIENAAKFSLSGSRSRLTLDIDPGLWSVDADRGQIGQVIQNIVLNADQAMPLGGKVVVSARNIAGGDGELPQGLAKRDHVLITIEDTGVGIPEENLVRIFDPYFTTKDKGNGLGLATTYSIIRNHDGLVTVRSTVGKGTMFLLYLPAAADGSDPEQFAAPAGSARAGRVLVMDDEEMVRLVAHELIKALGHEAVFAEDGEVAIRLYEEARSAGSPFDVVILDLTVRGGMGGAEAVQRLLAIDPAVQAVVSSGYSEDVVIADYHQHGFRAFLKKPYDIDDLKRTLNTLIG